MRQLAFASLVASELFEGQWGVNDGIRFNHANSSDGSDPQPYPDGLHVDTNNEARFRSVTAILYLNDVDSECGGATVFPLAGASEEDPALVAARGLLQEKATHTRGSVASRWNERASDVAKSVQQGAAMEARVDEESVLRIQPQAGMLCIFFSRTADGEIDPRSWHGGERILPPSPTELHGAGDKDEGPSPKLITEKNIMTLFKEVHYGDQEKNPPWDETSAQHESFESYLAPQVKQQRQYLEELAEAHARFFED